jgi:hypothetical protein
MTISLQFIIVIDLFFGRRKQEGEAKKESKPKKKGEKNLKRRRKIREIL